MPLAATLASEAVFKAFEGPTKADGLMHGHSYSGYPIGCATAAAALELYGDIRNPALCTPAVPGRCASGALGLSWRCFLALQRRM